MSTENISATLVVREDEDAERQRREPPAPAVTTTTPTTEPIKAGTRFIDPERMKGCVERRVLSPTWHSGIERRSLAGELTLSCVRPAADG